MKKSIRILVCVLIVLAVAVCVCACNDIVQQQEEEYEYIGCVFSVSNMQDGPTYYVLEMKYDFELSGRATVSIRFISNGQQGFQVKKGYYSIPKGGNVLYLKYDDVDEVISIGYYDTYIETYKARFQLSGANHLGEFECRAVYNYYGCDSRYGYVESSSSSQYIKKGSEITATAIPKDGYRFVRWSDGVATATRVDRNIQAEIDVTAEFEPVDEVFVAHYTAGEGGTINFEGEHVPVEDAVLSKKDMSFEVVNGHQSPKITATPSEGYVFSKWSDGVTTAERTDTLTQNLEVEAQFAKILTVEYEACDEQGDYINPERAWIEGETLQRYAEGTKTSEVVAKCDEYHRFIRWSDGVTTPARTDSHAEGTVKAIFGWIEYNVTYRAGDGGWIGQENKTESSGTITAGYDAWTTAIPKPGYRFVRWSDGVTTAERRDEHITADIEVEAQFVRCFNVTYSIECQDNMSCATIEGGASQKVDIGQSANQVTAVAVYDNYRFVRWSDGVETATRQDTNITEDISVTAIFEHYIVLDYKAGVGGYIEGETHQEISRNATPVTAVPYEGYTFVRWSDGNTFATRDDSYPHNSTSDVSVTAIFEGSGDIPTYTLEYTAGEGGAISGVASQAVSGGGSGSKVIAVAYAGYAFSGWSDGVETAERTDTNVGGNLSVTAMFERVPGRYFLTYTAGEGGTISGTLVQSVVSGSSGTQVTAVANEKFEFIRWSDGVTTASRTDSNVTEDLNVTAIFTEIDVYYDVILDFGYDNLVYKMRILSKSKIELPAPVRMGYTLTCWSSGNAQYAGNDHVQVIDNITLTANWQLNEYTITYELNGGTLENAVTTFTINDLPLTLQTPVPRNASDVFVKWTTDVSGENEISVINKDEVNLKNFTLYAQYYENLTYALNEQSTGYVVTKNNSNAENVIIPEVYNDLPVNGIDESAFANCTWLKSIIIPNSITSIGNSAFEDCSGLATVNWNATACTSAGNSSSPIFDGCTNLATVNIGDNVTQIPDYAFKDCIGLTTVNWNATACRTAGGYSSSIFSGCTKLETVNIGDKVTTIPAYVFKGCSGLTSITIPDSVTSMGNYAFYECDGLTNIAIPQGVKSIGGSAFYSCSGLTSITIPNSVTSIGYYAFYGCSGLTSVTIPQGVTSIGECAFQYCSGLTSITLPFVGATKEGTEYTHFGYIFGASSYNENSSKVPSGLKKVIITGGTNIGAKAFYGCSGLTSVTIPDSVTSIGEDAFYRCSGLISVTIGNGVTSIGLSTFFECRKLVEVYNKSSLNITTGSSDYGDVGLYAKNVYTPTQGASKLSTTEEGYVIYTEDESIILVGYTGNERELILPSNVMKINKYAFYRCSSLTSVTIPSSMKSIGNYAFMDCTGLTNVIIGNGVTSIGGAAFYSCSGLTSITIPDSVTSIGEEAFYDCSGLTSVTIGNGVTSIGYFAFDGCSGLTSIVVGQGNTTYHSSGNCLIETESKNLIRGCKTSVIPQDGSVTRIDAAFRDCSELTSVTIPNSVTSIYNYAFGDCSGLTSVTIGNGVRSIGYSAFDGCNNLNSVYITDLAKWCGIAFENAYANPLYYANNLYLNGEMIKDLVIPDGAKNISKCAFYGFSGLTSVTIPDSVTSIGQYAFCDCSGLTSITIPDSVTSIYNYAFGDCSGLTSVTIGNGVRSIGYSAFDGCSGLTTINYNGTMEQWNSIRKGNSWNKNTGNYTVYCTDGEVKYS